MKRFLPIAAFAILAACGGGNVQAQTVESSFLSATGDPINLDAVVTVQYVNGGLMLRSANKTPTNIPDSSQTLYTKLRADTWFKANFTEGYPGGLWYRNSQIILAYCTNNSTNLVMSSNIAVPVLSDNCTLYNQIKARSK